MVRVHQYIRPRKRKAGPARLTPEAIHEAKACSVRHGLAGFLRFLGHVRIEDKVTKGAIPFAPWPGQARLIPFLVAWTWAIALKGRQVGFTWLLAAYVTWRLIYHDALDVVVVNQDLGYARDFVRRVRYIYDRLPPAMRPKLTTKNKMDLGWEAHGKSCRIRAVASGAGASRSVTGDVYIVDEAAYCREFGETVSAMMPGAADRPESAQIIVLSTSAGPAGGFYDLWMETYGQSGELIDPDTHLGPTGFLPIFIHWSERPGRDARWYALQKQRLDRINPVKIKQEYPQSPAEAWEFSAGRVYPSFGARHIGEYKGQFPAGTKFYRAVDWGETKSAYVVLWIADIPGPPGLLVSPSCPNTIREMLAYRVEDDPPYRPRKEDDHAPDAIRYAITTFRLTGLIYVYREVYRKDCYATGTSWNPDREIEEIHELSGWTFDEDRKIWRRGLHGENISGTVVDRANSARSIAHMRQHQLPCRGHARLRVRDPDQARLLDTPLGERLEGIRWVTQLIDGTLLDLQNVARSQEDLAVAIYREDRRLPATVGLERRKAHEIAREIIRARRRGRRHDTARDP